MTTQETVQKYFDLSNKRDLKGIEELLQDDATYSSDNVGVHYGKEAIMAMKENFYGSFKTMHWEVHTMEETAPHVIRGTFTFTGTNTDGEERNRDGIENVVAVDGKVRHVEVRNT